MSLEDSFVRNNLKSKTSIFNFIVLKWCWYIIYKISYYSYLLSHLTSISSTTSVCIVILC